MLCVGLCLDLPSLPRSRYGSWPFLLDVSLQNVNVRVGLVLLLYRYLYLYLRVNPHRLIMIRVGLLRGAL